MPRLGSTARGRLVAVMQVTVPTDLTNDQVEALHQIQWQRSEAGDAHASDAEKDDAQAKKSRTKPKPKARKNPFRSKRR
jgi:molecular chaperone DnaJ